MLVQQILKTKTGEGVVTISAGSTVAQAAELLSEKRIGAVIVTAAGNPAAGILSERDIVGELGRRGTDCMADLVDDLMTTDLVTCTSKDSTDDVLAKMSAGRFRHMPVMSGDEMIGLISIGDVVKAQLSQLSMEKEALEGMIKGF